MKWQLLKTLRLVSLCALLLLSSLALSLAPFIASPASAASVYDNAYRKQLPPIQMISPTCGTVDVTAMATAMITESNLNGQHSGFGTDWFDIVNGEAEGVVVIHQNSQYNNGSLDGGYSGYIDLAYNKVDPTSIPLQWQFEPDPGAYENQSYLQMTRTNRYIGMYLNGSCTLSFTSGTGGVTENISSSAPGTVGIQADWRVIDLLPFCDPGVLCTGADALAFYNYPPGYDGGDINPVVPQYKPNIGYNTFTDGRLFALGLPSYDCVPTGLTETTGCYADYQYRYTLYAPDGTTVLKTQVVDNFGTFNYQLPGYDDYVLEVEFVDPPIPFLPLSPDAEFIKTRFQISYNGQLITGGSNINECTISGGVEECDPADPYEDCSTYGTDIGGYFQCVIFNFGLWLDASLKSMFLPSYSFFQNFQSQLGTFLNTKLGFIATAFTTIISLAQTIIDNGSSPDCTLDVVGQTLFGASVGFNVCQFEELNAVAFGFMQTLLIGGTAVALFFAGLRKYHEVVDQR